MTLGPAVVVRPAFRDLSAASIGGEVGPWRSEYNLDHRCAIEGVIDPFRYDARGVGVVPTGAGKVAAATTTAVLCASDELSLENSLILSVSVAGAPPHLPLGSIVVADSIVDCDNKCRFDSADGEPRTIEPNPYTGDNTAFDPGFDPDPQLVSWAESHGSDIRLSGLPDAPDPVGTVGTNVCADELWHGRALTEQVTRFVEEHDRGSYVVTEMEDSGSFVSRGRPCDGRID